jgi:hypothetical protein
MSLGLWPDAVPFDPDGTESHELRKHFDPARLPAALLVVCARDLRGSDWAPRAAIGLARALAGGARPVVLVDVDFEQPTLHSVLGEANGEGLADALLFGASLERVTLAPAGESFEFVPCGAYAPDPPDLMGHAGWARLLSELATRNALLLAYAPLGVPGLDTLADRISSVLVLAGEMEMAPTVAQLPETISVEGVVRPARPRSPAPAAVETAEPPSPAPVPVPEDETPAPSTSPAGVLPIEPVAPVSSGPVRLPKDEAREALAAELRARQRAAERGAEGEAEQTTGAHPIVAGGAPTRPSPAPRPAARTPRWVWPVLIAAVALVSWFVGQMMGGGRPEPTLTVAPTQPTNGPAEPAGVILGYSVAIEAYDQLSLALARADSLALVDSTMQFYIAPVRVDQQLFYRVMAGPLPDSASASVVLHSLVSRGLKTAANEDWDVRPTPLAFLLGQYEVRDSALSRMTALRAQGVPGYIIEVPYTQGPPRFHLYGGAYEKPSEAEVMREVLRRAGVLDTLVLRLGRTLP